MRVLVVEDGRRPLANAVATGLRREGIAVGVAYDGTSADQRLAVKGLKQSRHKATVECRLYAALKPRDVSSFEGPGGLSYT